jgi:hypothetical protein
MSLDRNPSYTDSEGRQVALLVHASQLTPAIMGDVEECVDWFYNEPMGTEAFINRLCSAYGQVGETGRYDVERLDTTAVKAIMRHARQVRPRLA